MNPEIVTVLGGIHGTFMYPQVLKEAPWIDCVVRGEGEQVFLNLVRAVDDGLLARRPPRGARHRLRRRTAARSSPRRPSRRSRTSTASSPTGASWSGTSTSTSRWGCAWRFPTSRAAAPSPAASAASGSSGATTASATRRRWSTRSKTWCKDHQVGFFILADEEPTIHRKKFIQFCEELIARNLPVLWGINTRVTDILRDEKLLPMFRKAGLVHVSLGTEAAAQLKLDRFNKETTIEQNKKAIRLLREAGIVTEAQFIVGLENETAETLEETYQMARDWNPDMANWAMYTPWPFSDLFQELGDKVEVFDFEKYNFVTPIMKPDAMDRGELLDRVMNNYRRFFMNKSFFQYPWEKDKFRRKYLMGCLKAFLKSGFERKFYDLGRVGYWGPQTKKTVDFGFDATSASARAGPTPRPLPRPTWAGSPCTGRRSSTSGARRVRPCRGGASGLRRRHRAADRAEAEPGAPDAPCAAALHGPHRPQRHHPRGRGAAGYVGSRRHARSVRTRRPAALPAGSRRSRWSRKPRCARLHAARCAQALGVDTGRATWHACAGRAHGRLPAGAPHPQARAGAAEAAAGAAGGTRAAARHHAAMPGPSPAAGSSAPASASPVELLTIRDNPLCRGLQAATHRPATSTPPPSSACSSVAGASRPAALSSEARGDDGLRGLRRRRAPAASQIHWSPA